MRLRLLYCFLYCFLTSLVSAQVIDEKNFTHYTTKDGLSNNVINSIAQDVYGYIWIATNKGLNRFDGSTFQQFYSDTSQNSLPLDFIHNLRWLDKEQLGVITVSGLHIINSRTLEQRNIVIPPDSLKSLLPVNRVRDAFVDKNRNIFIATATGFYQFNTKNELVFRYDHYSRKYIEEKKPAGFGNNIIQLDDNILLVASNNGAYLFYIDRKDFHPIGKNDDEFYQKIAAFKTGLVITHKDETSFSATNFLKDGLQEFYWFDTRNKTKHLIKAPSRNLGTPVPKVVRLNDSVFAINCSVNGFYLGHYDRNSNSYEVHPKIYFENNITFGLLLDKNNRLWIGTNNGLFRAKRSGTTIEHITQASSASKFTGDIHSLVVSGDKVFAGTIGEGLLVYDRVSLKLLKQVDFSSYKGRIYIPNFVYKIIPVHKDTLYAGVAGLWINTKTLEHGLLPLFGIDTTYLGIDEMFSDSRHNIYLKKDMQNRFFYRGNDYKFTLLDYRNELSSIGADIGSMAEDPEGNIWFTGAGIMRFNSLLQKFDLVLDSFPSIKTPRKGITSNLVFDKAGNLYFGVFDNGLIIYDLNRKKFTQFTRTDGLPDNNIKSVYLHNNKLWLATESGLANYDLSTKRLSSFGIADGIPTEPNYIYSLYYDSAHQQLYCAFKNTIFRFDPDKLTKNNIPPNFHIESIVIAGRETIYRPEVDVKLSYKQNNIVVNLGTVNFEDAYQQQFAYRIVKDGNEQWIEAGPQRSMIFSDLSPGNHQLQFKVYTRNQTWPEQIKEITLTVRPPFWETIWFYAIIALVVAGVLYYLHRSRINHFTQKANLDKQLAQTEMKALHSQMSPHFIFNCLNSIREMILNNENEQASLYLSKFARLIRITLNQSSKQFVSLTDTIAYLERYIEMEKIRSSHFNYTVDIAKELNPDDVMLPPMLIQPFIENAIWHGASAKKNIDIHISFKQKGNELVCVVEDNGIGIDESMKNKEISPNQPSVGIENIRQRIYLLNEKYNLQSTIRIEDKSALMPRNGSGTLVTLHLPIKTNESLWTT
jgi:ligand-binding sensor domain-containing protein